MPKYYNKKPDNTYAEVSYESHLEKADFANINFGELDNGRPKNQDEMSRLILSLQIKIKNIKDIEPKKEALPAEPIKPDTDRDHYEFYGINGSYDDRDWKKVGREAIPEFEYKPLLEKYTSQHNEWEENKKNIELKYNQELMAYQNSKDTLEKCEPNLLVLQKIDHSIRSELKNSIKIPTSHEVCQKFNDTFIDHKTKRVNDLKTLVQKIDDINHSSGDDEIKVKKILDEILVTYRAVIRSRDGAATTTIFGTSKGSTLANDLRDFCKNVYDVNLPKKLDKGVPLSVDLHPLNQNPVCQYLLDKDNLSPKFKSQA